MRRTDEFKHFTGDSTITMHVDYYDDGSILVAVEEDDKTMALPLSRKDAYQLLESLTHALATALPAPD